MKKALLIIDVQNHFTVEKAAGLSLKIVEHIKENSYDYILFSQYLYDPESNFNKILHWQGATKHPQIDISPELQPFVTDDTLFPKTTYSALKSQKLLDFLKEKNVTDIFLCGINIDGCVLATAYEAFDMGFKIEILEDLCSVSSTRQEYEDSAKVIIRRNLRSKKK